MSVLIQSKEVKLVPIKNVKPNPENRNLHSREQIDRLVEIIQYQGFRNPLIVSNRTGMLVAGHGRLEAAHHLKMTEVPVLYQDFENDEQEYAAGISDNSIAEWATLDLSAINTDIGNLGPDFNIDLLGINNFSIDVADHFEDELSDSESDDGEDKEIEDQENEELDSIPEKIEPRTKPGDSYRVAGHEVFNGDCLKVLKTLPSDSIDSLVTDPPAGISFMGKEWDDNKGGSKQWTAWMTEVMKECLRVLKPGAHGLVWALDKTSHWTGTALEDAGFTVKHKLYHLFGSGFPKNRNLWKNDFQGMLEEELRKQGIQGPIEWK